jgi:hypothetical protein
MSRKQNVYGEGNYEASRKYDEATKKFVESGRVEQAARDAKPRNAREAAEMQRAEEAGLRRAKDTRPAVNEPPTRRPAAKDPQGNPQAPRGKKAGAPPSRGRRQP